MASVLTDDTLCNYLFKQNTSVASVREILMKVVAYLIVSKSTEIKSIYLLPYECSRSKCEPNR